MLGILKKLYKVIVTDPVDKKLLLDWLEEHDTPEYHKNPLPVGYRTNRLWYEQMMSVEALEKEKQKMENYHKFSYTNPLKTLNDKQNYMQERLEKLQEDF